MAISEDGATRTGGIEAVWNALPKDQAFQQLKTHVEGVMSKFDPSHDFDHVLRVLHMSHRILSEEASRTSADPETVYYAALLHDLFDRKYATGPSRGGITNLLMEQGKAENWAHRVEEIVENVSWTYETTHPHEAYIALAKYPELAIVQDADRLDAIGAIGIGRVFTYGGAKAAQRGMQGSVDHFGEKLEKIEGRMKVSDGSLYSEVHYSGLTIYLQTESGKRMAEEKTGRLRAFRSWWEEEMAVSR